MADEDIIYKMAFTFIPNIGAVIAKNLISYCGGLEQVFRANKRQLLNTPGVGEAKAQDILNSNALQKAEAELKAIEGRGIDIVFYLDDNYPANLKL